MSLPSQSFRHVPDQQAGLWLGPLHEGHKLGSALLLCYRKANALLSNGSEETDKSEKSEKASAMIAPLPRMRHTVSLPTLPCEQHSEIQKPAEHLNGMSRQWMI